MLAEHGGNAFGLDILYDFSANLNPLGMPDNVKNVLINSINNWEKYPDHECGRLREKLSELNKVLPENIVCGNGAADLIYRIIRAVKPKKCLLASPCFSEYEKALREINCGIEYYSLAENRNFRLDEAILPMLKKGADMLILCSPNNPNGLMIPRELLAEICFECDKNNITFLCDECFLDFAENGENNSALNFMFQKTIVLKAFTKIFSMAGIRLGYAIFGSRELACSVRNCGQFWSVSTPAQIAGIAALGELNYIRSTREFISKERKFLEKKIGSLGIKVFDSDANFLLLKYKIPLYDALLREKLLVRGCSNFRGLDERFCRVAVRTHEENSALVDALGGVVNG